MVGRRTELSLEKRFGKSVVNNNKERHFSKIANPVLKEKF